MKKRELGKSGLFVSELSLGTMSLPDNETEAKNIVDAAIHAGINFFDTANIYDGGKNEKLVGKALKERRENVILATKVGNKLNPDGEGWTWNPTKNHIMEEVKHSLRRLGTDYIDLYQLHGGTIEDNIDETIDAFESLKKEGLIRQYGISSIRPSVIKRFLEKSTAISVMMQYSLLDRRPEEWFPLISGLDASIITRGTVAKGYLTLEGQGRANASDGFALYNASELQSAVNYLNDEVDDLHAASIAFALQDKTVASALVGARTTKQLLDSIIAYEKGCSTDQLERLKTLIKRHEYNEHRI
ncbi:aldo/keto reductase [Sporosarcina jiandibaonis]|uniref:aldo/keto reductase n=1 Tax=Sporosarcina jiandibaonis TaxID=2715535 RepID=UPI001555AAE9|nr:aldo/keto reductase [Sporosarcina jiandibaonis]